MSSSHTTGPITVLLAEIRSGDRAALDELLPLVYSELRNLARQHLNRERDDHTLQPTALVHEAYLKLLKGDAPGFENRAHFFGVAAHLMREILIDHARGKNSQKRGRDFKTQIGIESADVVEQRSDIDVLVVDSALNALAELDAQQARVVEMKFFAGMTIEEIAEVLDISPATVKREWATAKLFLARRLRPDN